MVEISATGAIHRLPFVQVLRVRAGKIVELREYFSSQARAQVFVETR